MIIDCIADLHGYYPELEGGDLLIVAGDLTARDSSENWNEFEDWICKQNYQEKIIIAGNHDNFLGSMDEHRMWKYWEKVGITYLCDSGTEFEGLKVWGSPWTKKFIGMNPHCMAFTCYTEEHLAEKWALIPQDIDILITHCPPHGCYLDQDSKGTMLGDVPLRDKVYKMNLKLHCFGHIHEGYGKHTNNVNASHVNERYQPVNKPVRVIL